MKKKYLAIIVVLMLAMIAGIALGIAMYYQKSDIQARRDEAQSTAREFLNRLNEARSRLQETTGEASTDTILEEKNQALLKTDGEREYRASEVSLLKEALGRTVAEAEKKSNAIETWGETLTERENMAAVLERERDALLAELNELIVDDGTPILTPAPALTPAPTVSITAEPPRPTEPPAAEVVLAQVGKREITYAQLKESFEQYTPQYENKYDLSDPSIVRMLMLDELNYLVELTIISEWAEDLGIAETVDSFMESAESFYSSLLNQKTASYLNGDAATEEEAREMAVTYLNTYHYTVEHIAQIMLNEDLNKRIKAYYAQLATPTEEELRAEYERLVEAAKSQYEQSPEAFEYDSMRSDPIYYYPSGYRVVKHLLLSFTAEEQLEVGQLLKERAALDPEGDDKRKGEIDARIGEIRSRYDGRISSALEQYESGVSFNELIEQMGEDPGMLEGVTAERGYYVSAETTVFDENFRDGAMAIETVGEISAPVLSGFGLHIIRYERDVPEGPADFESVRDSLEKTYGDKRREEAYKAAYEEWTAANPVEKYPGRLIEVRYE